MNFNFVSTLSHNPSTNSILSDKKQSPSSSNSTEDGLKRRKSVKFTEKQHHVRTYHEDEVVARVHIMPTQQEMENRSEKCSHHLIQFWGLPKSKRSRFDNTDELDPVNVILLEEIRVSSNQLELQGSLKVYRKWFQGDKFEIQCSNNSWKSYESLYAFKSITPLQNDVTSPESINSPSSTQPSNQIPTETNLSSPHILKNSNSSMAMSICSSVVTTDTENIESEVQSISSVRRSSAHNPFIEYTFSLNIGPDGVFFKTIQNQINEILSRNQDLITNQALSWNGYIEFRIKDANVNWKFALFVNRLNVLGNPTLKTLIDLGDDAASLNEDVEIVVSSSDVSRENSLECLAMATDELAIKHPEPKPSGVSFDSKSLKTIESGSLEWKITTKSIPNTKTPEVVVDMDDKEEISFDLGNSTFMFNTYSTGRRYGGF